MYTQKGVKEGEIESHYDALTAVLSSIPEELFHEIELEVQSAEGAATNKQRLEVLKEQQELIDEENKQATEDGSGSVSSKLDQDIDEKEKAVAAAESAKKDEDLTAASERHEGEKESPEDKEVEKMVDERRAKEAKLKEESK